MILMKSRRQDMLVNMQEFLSNFVMLLLLLLLNHFSRVQLCATPKTAAHQAPLSLGFSRQEHWSGLPYIYIYTPSLFSLPPTATHPSPLGHQRASLSHTAASQSYVLHMVVYICQCYCSSTLSVPCCIHKLLPCK